MSTAVGQLGAAPRDADGVTTDAIPTQKYRRRAGHQIDRSRVLTFSFDGRRMTGHPGDTLASALLANGEVLVGRSFKYHRPRGIMSAGSEEPNALAELRRGSRREPNTRMTTAELYDGLEATSQNRWPSLRYDLLSLNALAAPILAAGFYYKTFMWPASFWEKVYEPLIRRAAGLGRAAEEADPDSYEKANAFCDVLVIGSGPAGLMAALTASRAGARVILCEEDFRLGGRALAERRMVDERPAHEWAAEVEAELAAMPETRILRRTTLFGVYDGNTYGAVERVSDHLAMPPQYQPRQRLWRIVARRCVLASGAIERPLVFGGNDVPGVMLAGSVRSYLNRYGVCPARSAVVFANNDDATSTVTDLTAAGVQVVALIDSRADATRGQALNATGTELLAGSVVQRASGGTRLRRVSVRRGDGSTRSFDCDLLAMSGGWAPSIHLTSHLGGKPRWDERIGAFVPETAPPGMVVVGAAAGVFSLHESLAGGAQAGGDAAAACGFAVTTPPLPVTDTGEGVAVAPRWRSSRTTGMAFVDFQNDVTDKDIALAHREGFRGVELLKRYTTLGMATDQGKTSNLNGLALLAELQQQSIPEVGTTTFRPPFSPVAIGALGGQHRGREFRPTRQIPGHAWAMERGAAFVEAGDWLRPQYFPAAGETDWLTTVNREVLTVRSGVGFCDVTTLGKISIQGPDAARLLECVYTNSWANLPVGRARYGLMLREDGFVFDDGTTSRLGETEFVMTTTTANAGRVMQHLEFCHQWLWPALEVHMVSVTDQWAQYAVAGPRSRDVLRRIVDPGHDISNDAFPYMAASNVTICGGVTARLFRLSFSGELAYELAVPARFGDALARQLEVAGGDFGITPYGTEALGVMRIEKGHAAGGELTGQTTAHDLGMARLLSRRKDFVGRAMAARPALADPGRPRLVGLRPVQRDARLRAGAHLLAQRAEAIAANDQGWVTSAAFSPTLGHSIALGLLANGPERMGEVVRVYDAVRNADLLAEVVSPVFVDPEGARLHG